MHDDYVFPHVVEGVYQAAGMGLRDLFAMAAMAGNLAIDNVPQDDGWEAGVARAAYRLADAMLRERQVTMEVKE